MQCKNWTSSSSIPNLDIPPKILREGRLPKHILKKNNVLRKKGVEIWTFDGS
jgi:hypothetical protein